MNQQRNPFSVALEERLEESRRTAAALAFVLRIQDEEAALVLGARLRQDLLELTRLAGTDATRLHDPVILRSVDDIVAGGRVLISRAPTQLDGFDESFRARWEATASELATPLDLFGLQVYTNKDLAGADFSRLRMARCLIDTSMLLSATFDRSWMWKCNWSLCRMARTVWRGAQLHRCTLCGVELLDAMLDDAVFVECDFRYADLRVEQLGLLGTTRRTKFVRCDLRNTKWEGRSLTGAVFDECRFHGVSGRPSLEGVEIERPDLSEAGDGSVIGHARDVLALWDASA